MLQNRTIIGLVLLVILQGCGVSRQVTTETKTITNYVDSLVIRDSTIYHTETRIKDYSIIPDTLKLEGTHSSAKAYVDTTNKILAGELKEKPWKEKVVYKDKIVYRDTTIIKEVPVEIEVVKKVIPKWCWYLLAGNILLLLIGVLCVVIKLKS